MKESILNALETEQQLHNMVEGLKKEVVQEVRTTSPLDGVKPIEGTSLRCAMVSSSAIFASKGLVMAADYYIQDSQADIVQAAISPCQSVRGLMDRLQNMSETSRVSTGGASGSMLNEQTVSAISKFVTE